MLIKQNKYIDNLLGMGSIDQIFNVEKELSTLLEDRFKLSDLNITARVLVHWKEKGLLPDKNTAPSFLHDVKEDKQKGDKSRVNRFNFFELIYLYIIQDLRNMGFSIEKLKNVKIALLNNLGFLDLLQLIGKIGQSDHPRPE